MNKWLGIGRLTADPEIRYSQGEKSTAIARCTLAVDRRFRDGADFISCKAFGKTAEFLERFGKKGTKFAVEGRIETGSYEKDGRKVYTTEVVVDSVEFAESKSASSGGQSATNGQPASTPSSDPAAAANGFMNIPDNLDDDTLPFN